MADLKTRLTQAFAARFGGMPDLIARAPGRVNLIGEHTDYNDGFVLPMAIGCQTMVAARARDDEQVLLHALDFQGAESCFSLNDPIRADDHAPWSNYVRGVADSLQRAGLKLQGADLLMAGDVPRGAGLSSSASLEMASGLALATLAGHADYDRTGLALAGQRAEHEYAGCKCGIMDQLVSAHGVAGHAALIDCRTLGVTPVAMPDDIAVMIIHSGIERGLVDGEYNTRRAQCETAARHYGVIALRDMDMAALEAGQAGLDAIAYRRARHVVSENARTCAAASALGEGNLAEMGLLMAESHQSMRDDFEITTPEIDHLVTVAQSAIAGKGGARMTGGGFGGAVVAVMPQTMVASVKQSILMHYKTPLGSAPLIMIETAHEGVSLISV